MTMDCSSLCHPMGPPGPVPALLPCIYDIFTKETLPHSRTISHPSTPVALPFPPQPQRGIYNVGVRWVRVWGLAFKLGIRGFYDWRMWDTYLMNCQNGNILQWNIFLFMGTGGPDSSIRYGIPECLRGNMLFSSKGSHPWERVTAQGSNYSMSIFLKKIYTFSRTHMYILGGQCEPAMWREFDA